MKPRHTIAVLLLLSTCVSGLAPAVADTGGASSSAEVLALPAWLELRGHHRTRYEALEGQFRGGRGGNDEIVVLRTALAAVIDLGAFDVTLEVVDSRQALADESTPLNTTIVNPLELLQGHVAIDLRDVILPGSRTRLLLGRHTMDVGGRRLIARNRFRNTINSFTGVNATWEAASGVALRAFYALPVRRMPSDASSLRDNDIRFDEETLDVQFWGFHAGCSDSTSNVALEFSLLGIHEDDTGDHATRNRDLFTGGTRVRRASARGKIDFEFESVFQLGTSRATSAATDTVDLDHLAHFHHVEIGYTLDAAWTPRVTLQFDYASGDEDPDDDDNNRFDTLLGARRFDFGPTGIYGAFARSNIISPGYRFIARPHRDIDVMFSHRSYWLASDTDAWTTAGVRDPTGNSGRHVGHQAEVRIRWSLLGETLAIESGAARLFAGAFVETAADGGGDATYTYVQSVLTL